MAYLGLVPSEHSSGNSVRRGSITKTGNAHARRLLTEAAWSYRFPAAHEPAAARAQPALPEPVRNHAWKAQLRLCGRFARLSSRGVQVNKVCVAVARELAGFVWAIAHQARAQPAPSAQLTGESRQVAWGDAARITMGRTLTRTIDRRPFGQPACLERGSFHDGSMHGGSQPTDISLIHRRSSRLVPHHPSPHGKKAKSDRQPPPLTPPQGAGKSSPPDGLGGQAKKATPAPRPQA